MAFPEHPHGYLFGNVSWNVPVVHELHNLNVVHHLMQKLIYTRVDGQKVNVVEQGKPNHFEIDGKKCSVKFRREGNVFSYTLEIEGNSFEACKKKYQKDYEMWKMEINGQEWVVVHDKKQMQVFANGQRLETETNFHDDGTVVRFSLGQTQYRIESAGSSMNHLNCFLYKNDELIPSLLNLNDPGEKRHDARSFYSSLFPSL